MPVLSAIAPPVDTGSSCTFDGGGEEDMPVHAATSAVFKKLQKISCLPATDQSINVSSSVLVQGFSSA
jgi:hypothetical protein